MAAPVQFSLILFFACAFLLQGTLGEKDYPEVDCETLEAKKCAFAVNTQGKFCVLTEDLDSTGSEDSYKCIASSLKATEDEARLETEKCKDACGVDRYTIGIPTPDSIHKYPFIAHLCSSDCDGCTNIQDLYSIVARKGGIDLDALCTKGQKLDRAKGKTSDHRSMAEVQSDSPAPAPGGARPVSDIASSLWHAATGLFESGGSPASSPSASKTVDNVMHSAASSPSVGDAVASSPSAGDASASSPSAGDASASSPSAGGAAAPVLSAGNAAGYEDDYSA